MCPARVSYPERRRFFETAAAAERDGYRPCMRCRPELAPGRALCDAVPRIARAAALKIAAGALNGRSVAELAGELGVGERQLRRAMERELGVSPVELAQTHRLLLAKCLLTDTPLPVTRIAFSSGFQSLRRFNSTFQERYRMSPSALRRGSRTADNGGALAGPDGELVRLTLAYRPPLAWETLLGRLASDAIPGVEVVEGGRYGRTVNLEGCRGVVFVGHGAGGIGRARGMAAHHLTVDVSVGLLPALMPLLARLRHLFDLDAEPAKIDAHLAEGGLARLVRRRPGLRMPGAFDGFESAARELLRLPGAQGNGPSPMARLVAGLAEPVETGFAGLDRGALNPGRVADAGPARVAGFGVPAARADSLVGLARAVSRGGLRLEPGADVPATLRALEEVARIEPRLATGIVMRALHWPDAFSADDPVLRRGAGVSGTRALLRLAERWRPWRAYAAEHLRMS